MKTLAERIALALKKSGKTQTYVAKVCGITPTSINNLLKGKSLAMKAETAHGICKATRVSHAWLVYGVGPMETGESYDSQEAAALLDEASEEDRRMALNLIRTFLSGKRQRQEDGADKTTPERAASHDKRNRIRLESEDPAQNSQDENKRPK